MKRGEKPKILIADASKANRSALREILEGQYQIQEALEAEEALEAFRQEAPSLALIGSLGPEAGGLRLLAAMSRDPPDRAHPGPYDCGGGRGFLYRAGL